MVDLPVMFRMHGVAFCHLGNLQPFIQLFVIRMTFHFNVEGNPTTCLVLPSKDWARRDPAIPRIMFMRLCEYKLIMVFFHGHHGEVCPIFTRIQIISIQLVSYLKIVTKCYKYNISHSNTEKMSQYVLIESTI